MADKKILFLTRGKGIVDFFWSDEAKAKAKALNYDVDVPAEHGDILDFDFAPILHKYDALITSWSSPCCNAELLKHAPNVKIVGHSAGSVALVVDETTFDQNIKVTSANPVMAEAVAEWALLATMLAARDFWKYAQWMNATPLKWGVGDIRDNTKLTLGLWGMGDTTKHLLRMLKPLRFKRILICSNHSSAEELSEWGAEKASFEQVFAESDIIHCLVGANQQNLYKVDAKVLATIKDGATLVNCGRAKLIAEQPLLEELQKRRFTAILDVFHEEPLAEDSILRKLDNVILTPHNAGYTGRNLYIPFILDQFDAFFKTGKMSYDITRERWRTQTNEKIK